MFEEKHRLINFVFTNCNRIKQEFNKFEEPFRNCVKKLLQSKQTIYFKTSCDFLCKFLQYLSKLSDDLKLSERNDTVTVENADPTARTSRKNVKRGRNNQESRSQRGHPVKRGTKRKSADSSDDELIPKEFHDMTAQNMTSRDSDSEDSAVTEAANSHKQRRLTASTPIITNHDKLISSCLDVADLYMQVSNEECRYNAVFLVSKFMATMESVDEGIIDALKLTLPKRIRDRKPMIRAQAVIASRTFQDHKMIHDGFLHHFYRDPELIVRKALLQVMDPKIYGVDFLIDSTQDAHEVMRKSAFQRLGKLNPKDLTTEQLHRVLHNGLGERDRHVSYNFKTHTLEPWLPQLYDGVDLHKLLGFLNVIDNHEDVCKLMELLFERDLEKLQNNGTTTHLHKVVESFRETWLVSENVCLPSIETVDVRVVTIWLTLVKFCKINQGIIKPVVVRNLQTKHHEADDSIEKIIDSQENDDELVELYERLMPDLVNLVNFLDRFVNHSHQIIGINKDVSIKSLEFIYQQLMLFTCSFEIGDELERKTVQEVFGNILRDNLLTGKFQNFVPPILKSLFHLVYSLSSKLMINYISEMIHNVRSHLEDLVIDAKLTSTMIGSTSLDDSASSNQSNKEDLKIFTNHPNDLLKCLQMYLGCLQCVRVNQVPQTMLNQLNYLSYESLDDNFKGDVQVRRLMVACNGLTGLVDNEFAKQPTTMSLLTAACFDQSHIEIRTTGFKCLVDIICQHVDIDIPEDKIERFLRSTLREYGKYNPNEMQANELEFITNLVEGATKLFYFRRISSSQVLSHLIIWWYHPRTPSKLKQFIGIFLPTFVDDLSRGHDWSSEKGRWLKDLLVDTFVISIEYLHDYILNAGYNIMAANDMLSLINFLANLVPISLHSDISERVEARIDDLSDSSPDLVKYLKQSKNNLTLLKPISTNNETVVQLSCPPTIA